MTMCAPRGGWRWAGLTGLVSLVVLMTWNPEAFA